MCKLINLIGKQFTRLTVVKRVENTKWNTTRYLCKCSCGNETIVEGNNLRRGTTKSCGCLSYDHKINQKGSRNGKYINLTGKIFGRLRVIELGIKPKNSKSHHVFWKCYCDPELGGCSTILNIDGGSLRSGRTQSCGCLNSEINSNKIPSNKLPLGDASFNTLYARYRANARDRNKEWSLTKKDFKILTQSKCFYCDSEPSQIVLGNGENNCNGNYIYNGIDRLDNNIGYIIDNCVSCCKRCNYAKHNMTKDEFIELVKKIYLKHGQT